MAGKCQIGKALALGVAPGMGADWLMGKAFEAGGALLGAVLGAEEAPSPEPCNPVVTVTHQIKHKSFLAALAGAVVGALLAAAVSAAAVALIGATGGAAIAVGGLAVLAAGPLIGKASSAVTNFIDGLFPADDGPVAIGSPNVFAEGKPVARAGVDTVACVKHKVSLVAQGSETVSVNGSPLARIDDKTACGAEIKQGAKSVVAGTGHATVVEIADEFNWAQKALLVGVDYLIPPTKGLIKGAAKNLRKAPKALKGVFKVMSKGGMKNTFKFMSKRIKGAGKSIMAGACKLADDFMGQRKKCIESGKGPLGKTLKALFGDPIDTATGSVYDQREDFTVGQSLPLTFVRTYHSQSGETGLLGRGWNDTFGERLTRESEDMIHYHAADGQIIPFDIEPGFRRFFNRRHPHLTLECAELGYDIYNHEDDTRRHFEWHGAIACLKSIADNHGNTVIFFYGGDHRNPVRVVHGDGPRLRLEYENGFLGSIWRDDTEEPVRLARYSTANGLLTEAEITGGYHFRYEYDRNGRLAAWSDSSHTRVVYRYDEKGRCVASEGPDGYYKVSLDYDEENHVTRVLQGSGGITELHFDDDDLPVKKVDPLGGETLYEYNKYGQIVQQTRPGGVAERFAYDVETGLLTEETDAEGNTFLYEHDADLRPVSVTDPLGRRWEYEYKDEGRPASVAAPGGLVWQYGYDNRGNLAEIVRPDGKTREFLFDDNNRMTGQTDWEGQEYIYEYDGRDRLVGTEDPAFNKHGFDYNARDLLVRVKNPDGTDIKIGYDLERNPVSRTDENRNKNTAEYGPFDMLTEQADGEGLRYGYDYDRDHLLLSKVRAPDGRVYKLERDHLGRIVGEKDYQGREWHYVYDEAGNLSKRIDPSGESVRYTHDKTGNLLSAETKSGRTEYEYDKLGRIVRAENEYAVLEWEYDEAGRVAKAVQNGQTLEYVYDKAGNLVERVLHPSPWQTDPHRTGFDYDANGDLTGLSLDPDTLVIDRDALGRDVVRQSESGFVLRQEYDSRSMLAAQSGGRADRTGGPMTANISRDFEYDPAQNLVAVSDRRWGDTRYAHDRADQIVETANTDRGNEKFRYGTTGLLAGTVSFEPGGQGKIVPFEFRMDGSLSGYAGSQCEYDACGRLTAKTVHKNGFRPQKWEYEWNALDQLVQVKTPKGETWQYQYDPVGRRVLKYNPATGESVHFLWDGDVLLQEVRLTGKGESQTAEITYWHHEPDTFRPIAKEENGQLFYVVTDHIGAPRELLTPEGELAWAGCHRTWGRADRKYERGTSCPIRYPGQYEDEETGLHYNRFRYYDPDSGRYISPDPIGLEGGPQPMAYVPNPNFWVDPLGLAKCSREVNDTKIYGKGQRTDKAHAQLSELLANKLGMSGKFKEVHMHRSYNATTGVPVKPNRKPDITAIDHKGRVHAIEIASKTDMSPKNFPNLRGRNLKAQGQLPSSKRGDVIVIKKPYKASSVKSAIDDFLNSL